MQLRTYDCQFGCISYCFRDTDALSSKTARFPQPTGPPLVKSLARQLVIIIVKTFLYHEYLYVVQGYQI